MLKIFLKFGKLSRSFLIEGPRMSLPFMIKANSSQDVGEYEYCLFNMSWICGIVGHQVARSAGGRWCIATRIATFNVSTAFCTELEIKQINIDLWLLSLLEIQLISGTPSGKKSLMKNDLKNEARNKNSFGKDMSAISKETRSEFGHLRWYVRLSLSAKL